MEGSNEDLGTAQQFLEAYRSDGTRLWRIDLGINVRAGAHYTQFLVYDFDGDGIDEADYSARVAAVTVTLDDISNVRRIACHLGLNKDTVTKYLRRLRDYGFVLQLTRDLRPLPVMKINPEVRSIFDFKFSDFSLQDYDPHPHIKAEVAV